MDKKRAFTDAIKLRPSQKAYIRSIAGEYSMAGKLDEIINFYKANGRIPSRHDMPELRDDV